jgi:hypothetical protein
MDAIRQGHDGVKSVRVPLGSVALEGDLNVPSESLGVILFAHGSVRS